MSILIIVRHGQSAWNLENRFTGGVDIDLTPLGVTEAIKAGQQIKQYPINTAYTSVLKRAIESLDLILKEMNATNIPVVRTSALNERNYGDLQGLNKGETEKKYGAEQVLIWRRSFEVAPPGGESLKNTYDRVVPYYKMEMEPKLRAGKNLLVVAHGNSLRALMMYLEKIGPDEIAKVNLPTGVPRLYEFDAEVKLMKCYYLE